MAATALSSGMPLDDSVGTAPPWLKGNSPIARGDLGGSMGNMADPSVPRLGGPMSVGAPPPPTMGGAGTGSSANQPNYSGLASAMVGPNGGMPTPNTGGAMSVAAPPAPSLSSSPPGSPPSTPGITLGSQSAYTGGPSVTTSNVNYGGLAPVSTDFSGDAQHAADSAYKGATQYFNEDFTHANNDLQNQLINQGFAPGSEGYNRQMELQQRGQDQARTGAALAAQQQGFTNAGDLLQRALAARQQGVSELNTSADRTFNQSLGVAGLGLGARGQDLGLQGAQAGAGATLGAAGANASASNYRADLDAQLGLRGLGLQQDNQEFNQMLQLSNLSQGSVPGLNFGSATPLDVGGAYNTSVAANNAAQNRTASNNNALYSLGGNLLGSYLRGG